MTLWENNSSRTRRFPRPHILISSSSPSRHNTSLLPTSPFLTRKDLSWSKCGEAAHALHPNSSSNTSISKSNPCHLLQNHQVVKPSTPSSKVHVHHMEPTACNPFYTANKTNGSHKLNNSENTETPPPPRVQRTIAHRSSTLRCLNLP